MLNALRLVEGVRAELFSERTGLDASVIGRRLALGRERGLLEVDTGRIRPTRRGRLFLNDLVQLFL
jgi:oxygen-independent coproporphyrinogen-3 oxidase